MFKVAIKKLYVVNLTHCLKNFSDSNVSKLVTTSSSSSEIIVETLKGAYSGTVVLTLNRPSARNALGSNLTTSLENAVKKVTLDESARVVIFRSALSGVFCAGADLKERIRLSNSEVSAFVARLNALTVAIENIPVPTIAAIDGSAFGGGLELALACDMRTVSMDAKLGLVETKWAIIPGAGGSQRLPRIINPAIAKEFIYCARIFDGEKAEKIGLANYAVEQNSTSDAAYQKALRVACDILANGPLGVKMAKMAINQGLKSDILTGCKIEELCYANVIPTKDRIEGLTAFLENRIPKYKGE